MSTYGPPAQRDVVTGEAVALDLRLAQLPSRSLALMMDMAIQIATLFGVAFLVGTVGGALDDAMRAAVLLVAVVSVIVGYPLTLETATRGRTVGKLAMGLRAVRDDGGPVRFRHSLVRALIEFVEIWLLVGVPALICSLANSQGKRLGDLAAGTVVVRERMPARRDVLPPMPPELAGWATAADLGRVPDELALAARQFLVRARELTPQASWTMAVRLASDIHPYLAPPPPQQAPPDRLLAAVVAERRRRESLRLQSQAAATRGWVDHGWADAGHPTAPAAGSALGPPGQIPWSATPPVSPPAPPPAPTPVSTRSQPPPPPPVESVDGGFAAPG